MKTFILLSFILFLPIIPPSLQQFNPLGGFDFFEEEQRISAIILGSGSDSVSIHLVEGDPSNIRLQWGRLYNKGENEWTFEIVTGPGSLYNFIDDDGRLIAKGPHHSMIDISLSYAEYAEVSVDEAAWALGEYVVNGVNTIYDALGIEQID